MSTQTGRQYVREDRHSAGGLSESAGINMGARFALYLSFSTHSITNEFAHAQARRDE